MNRRDAADQKRARDAVGRKRADEAIAEAIRTGHLNLSEPDTLLFSTREREKWEARGYHWTDADTAFEKAFGKALIAALATIPLFAFMVIAQLLGSPAMWWLGFLLFSVAGFMCIGFIGFHALKHGVNFDD